MKIVYLLIAVFICCVPQLARASEVLNTTMAVEWSTGFRNYHGVWYYGPHWTGRTWQDSGAHRVPKMAYEAPTLNIWTYYDSSRAWYNTNIPVADVWINNGQYGIELATGKLYKNPQWLSPKECILEPNYLIGQDYVYNGMRSTATVKMQPGTGTFVGYITAFKAPDGEYYTKWTIQMGFAITNVFFGSGVCGNAPMYAKFAPPTAAKLSFCRIESNVLVWESAVEYDMIGYRVYGEITKPNLRMGRKKVMIPIEGVIPVEGFGGPATYSVQYPPNVKNLYLYEVGLTGRLVLLETIPVFEEAEEILNNSSISYE